jgi:Sortase domain
VQRRTAIVTSVTAIVAGCAAAVAVPLAFSVLSSDGAAPVRSFGAGAPTRLAEQRPATTPSGSGSTVPGNGVRTNSKSARRPAVTTAVPNFLTVGGTAISARVIPVGVDAIGSTAIPERVDTVGWYRFGPQPGARAGSIVLVGHVDSAQQGEGAFFRLHTVRPGAIVSITATDRRVFRYRVVGRQEYRKTSVPLAALFARTGAPHLTLITCGGSFDAKVRHYRDNVVVTAVPFP